MKIARVILILFFVLVQGSCVGTLDEILSADRFSWNPKLAAPIISSQFSLNDLIEEVDSASFIEIDQNNLITLVYSSSIRTNDAESYFFIPSQFIEENVTVPELPAIPDGQSAVLSSQLILDFDATSYILDSVMIKSGIMELAIETDIPADIKANITLQSFKKDGQVLFFDLESDFIEGGEARSTSTSKDLSNTLIDFNQPSPNTFILGLEVQLTGKGFPISANDNLTLRLDITNPAFRRIHGTFPSTPVEQTSDTLEITFFNRTESGQFGLADPSIDFEFVNGFGIPLAVDLSRIKVRKGVQEVQVEGSLSEQLPEVSGPFSYLDEAATSTVIFNKDNSNLSEMIGILPDEFIYQFAGQLNPDDRGLFVCDTSKIGINYDIRIPLDGWVDDMSLTRDYDFDGSLLEETNDMSFKITTQNELPLTMSMQIYFLDQAGTVTDSLFSDQSNIILASEVDQDGRSVGSSKIETTVALSESAVINGRNSQFIRVSLTVNSRDSESRKAVKIRSSDQLDLKISMLANFEIDL